MDRWKKSTNCAVLSCGRRQSLALRVYGRQQANSDDSQSRVATTKRVGRQDWFQVGGGKRVPCDTDPKDPEIITRIPIAAR